MKTDRVKLLKYQRIINMPLQNKLENEKDIDYALGGLVKLIQHSDQDHILAEAIKTVCNFLFCSSFFTEDIKELFMIKLHEEAQMKTSTDGRWLKPTCCVKKV